MGKGQGKGADGPCCKLLARAPRASHCFTCFFFLGAIRIGGIEESLKLTLFNEQAPLNGKAPWL